MADKKSKQKNIQDSASEISEQLEQAFLAGLGALSDARERGTAAFSQLVQQGESFRKDSSAKTEDLIDEVRASIRSMAGDAQSRATGLLDHMRETPQLDKLQSVFDDRVANALERVGVASRKSIDDLDSKLDRVLKTLEASETKPKKAPAKPAKKKAAKKKVSKKKAAPKKAASKKKTVSRKKPATKKASSKKKAASKKSKS